VDFELDGKTQKLPMPALINLRSHPDEATRRRGYEAENVAWEGVKETLAACLNGVKGEATLEQKARTQRRVHAAIEQARIDRNPRCHAGAMKDSFPMFRSYFNHKAKLLGKEKLAWWDLFAPMGKTDKVYSFDEARDFILETSESSRPSWQSFAKRAFEDNWIDAEQREGKRGGALLHGSAGREGKPHPGPTSTARSTRSATLAHELGHAFHNECAYQATRPRCSSSRR
jgi:oligoendopeptidase F